MSDKDNTVLSELDDLEFEIAFIENICKKLKNLESSDASTNTLLFLHMSITESLKKYYRLAKDNNRAIHYEDAVKLSIMKGESFLSSVANDESKAPYVQKSLSDMYDLLKGVMFSLKKELTETPKYAHLKPKLE